MPYKTSNWQRKPTTGEFSIFSRLLFLVVVGLVVNATSQTGVDPKLLAEAKAGDARAEALLGNAYWLGDKAPKDWTKAAFWFRKAAEQGVAEAQSALGSAYRNGHGVPQDYSEAYFWLDIAAAGDFWMQPDLKKITELEKDDTAARLTPGQLVDAQARARRWSQEHQSPERAERFVAILPAHAECMSKAKQATDEEWLSGRPSSEISELDWQLSVCAGKFAPLEPSGSELIHEAHGRVADEFRQRIQRAIETLPPEVQAQVWAAFRADTGLKTTK